MRKPVLHSLLVAASAAAILISAHWLLDRTEVRRHEGRPSVSTTPGSQVPLASSTGSDHRMDVLVSTLDIKGAAAPTEEPAAIDSSLEVGVAPSTPVDEELERSIDEAFELLYGTLSTSDLEQEYETVNEQIQAAVSAACKSYLDAGRYEVIGYGTKVNFDVQDRKKLVAYQLVPFPDREDREIRRVELIEEEYPAAYSLHRRALCAFDLLREKGRTPRSK